jgi:hypothetical protein
MWTYHRHKTWQYSQKKTSVFRIIQYILSLQNRRLQKCLFNLSCQVIWNRNFTGAFLYCSCVSFCFAHNTKLTPSKNVCYYCSFNFNVFCSISWNSEFPKAFVSVPVFQFSSCSYFSTK